MVNFKEDSWLYALIAAILGAISIFTPSASQTTAGVTQQVWLGGFVSYLSGGGFDDWFGTQGAQLWYLGVSLVCITLLMVYSINSWRGKEFKWDWLIYLLTGLGMFIFSILFWTDPALEDVDIGFASIGIFIAGILAILAFVLDKFGAKLFGGE